LLLLHDLLAPLLRHHGGLLGLRLSLGGLGRGGGGLLLGMIGVMIRLLLMGGTDLVLRLEGAHGVPPLLSPRGGLRDQHDLLRHALPRPLLLSLLLLRRHHDGLLGVHHRLRPLDLREGARHGTPLLLQYHGLHRHAHRLHGGVRLLGVGRLRPSALLLLVVHLGRRRRPVRPVRRPARGTVRRGLGADDGRARRRHLGAAVHLLHPHRASRLRRYRR